MSRGQSRQFALVGIGFAFFLAMNSFSLWGFSFLPQFAFGDASAFWNVSIELSYVAAFFFYFFGASRFASMQGKAPFLPALLFCFAGAVFLVGYLVVCSSFLLCLAGVLLGIGTVCCFECWEIVFSQSELHEAKKQIVFGSVLSVIPFALFFAAGDSWVLLVELLLMVGNFVFLFASLSFSPDFSEAVCAKAASFESKRPCCELISSSWKPLLCIAMIGVISPILNAVVREDSLTFSQNCAIVIVANFLAAVALGLVWFGFKKDISVTNAYFVLFPFFLTAFVVFPFMPERFNFIVLLFGSFAFSFFSIVMMMSCVKKAEEEQRSLPFVYSLFAGTLYGSHLLGEGISMLLQGSSVSQEVLIVVCSFLLLYCCSLVMFALVPKRRLASEEEGRESEASQKEESFLSADKETSIFSIEESAPTEDSCVGADFAAAEPQTICQEVVHKDLAGVDVLHEACLQIASERGLSPRQTEVLDLLARGYTVPSIAEKLYISENTVRTHAKNIYQLLDVHSKREVIELVNDRCVRLREGSFERTQSDKQNSACGGAGANGV